MGVTASDKGGASFQLAPVGNHLAICVQVVDLGTQSDSYQGKPKLIRKVRISFELPEEKAVFDEAKGEESFMVSKEYTLSLSDRANLRHDLESWRGKPFTPEELKKFPLSKLLGKHAMVACSHETSAQKRQYVKIQAVTSLPKNTKAKDLPKPTLPIIEYEIDDGNNDVFKSLPEFLQEKILASTEVKADVTGEKKDPAGTNGGHDGHDDDEVIPF